MFCYKSGGSSSYTYFLHNFFHIVIFGLFLGLFRASKSPIGPEGPSNYMLKIEGYHMHE